MKKICLLKPRVTGLLNNKVDIPYGLLCLGSALEKAGYHICIIDLTDEPYDIIPEADLYGLTAYTIFYDECIRIKNWLRKNRNPDSVIVVGGPHASIMYESMVNDGFDYIFTGEGEKTFPLVADRLISREYPDIIINGEPIENLDDYVLNYRLINPDDYTRKTDYEKTISIMSSRGCPYKCSFCWTANNYQSHVRFKSAKATMDEIQHIFSIYGKRNICFLDDSFLADKKRAIEIMEELQKRDIKWECECNIAHLQDAEICKKIDESGCYRIFMGIESGSDYMLRRMNKPQTTKTIKKAIENIKQSGDIIIRASIMIGFPGETWETINESIDFLVELNFDEYTLYTFTPFPGTDPFHRPEKYGITNITKDYSDFYLIKGNSESSYSFETETLNPSVLKEMREYTKAALDNKFISSARVISEGN